MAWDGSGNFPRTNGTNTGAETWQDDAAAATKIRADRHDTHDQDIADGIAACLTQNNESKPTATFLPNVDATYDLGSSSKQWKDGYFSGDLSIVGDLSVTGSITGAVTLGTPQTTTSGTSKDFTGIPAGVKNVVIMFAGVDFGTTSDEVIIQIGDSGGLETTAYRSASSAITGTNTTVVTDNSSTTGFWCAKPQDGGNTMDGRIEISLLNSSNNTWVSSSVLHDTSGSNGYYGSGSKSLSGVLDRLRITTYTGTSTFSAGEINIQYS